VGDGDNSDNAISVPSKRRRRGESPKETFDREFNSCYSALNIGSKESAAVAIERLLLLLTSQTYIRSVDLPKRVKALWKDGDGSVQTAATAFEIVKKYAETYKW
jgi:hypothetical protein